MTLLLFVLGAGMILAAGLVSLWLSHASSGRRELRRDLERVLFEVDRALADPILVNQAIRKVRRGHSRDG